MPRRSPLLLMLLRCPLLRPFSYLWIRGAKKRGFDLVLPAFFAVVSTLCVIWLRPQLFMSNGLFAQIGSMVQNLPGFYIAALAAVATFQRDSLDARLPAPTPTLLTFINGVCEDVPLTRRRLLTTAMRNIANGLLSHPWIHTSPFLRLQPPGPMPAGEPLRPVTCPSPNFVCM